MLPPLSPSLRPRSLPPPSRFFPTFFPSIHLSIYGSVRSPPTFHLDGPNHFPFSYRACRLILLSNKITPLIYFFPPLPASYIMVSRPLSYSQLHACMHSHGRYRNTYQTGSNFRIRHPTRIQEHISPPIAKDIRWPVCLNQTRPDRPDHCKIPILGSIGTATRPIRQLDTLPLASYCFTHSRKMALATGWAVFSPNAMQGLRTVHQNLI